MDSRYGKGGELDALDAMRKELQRLLAETAYPADPPAAVDPAGGIDFRAAVAEYERALIAAALRLTKGRQNRAAELLHLNPSTLCTKMKALGIDPAEF